jgi:hypothetical protein
VTAVATRVLLAASALAGEPEQQDLGATCLT